MVALLSLHRAFMSGVERAPDIPLDVIRDVWATNVAGTIHMTQAVLRVFKKRPDGGKGDVIMLGSLAGREPYAGGSVSDFSVLMRLSMC